VKVQIKRKGKIVKKFAKY